MSQGLSITILVQGQDVVLCTDPGRCGLVSNWDHRGPEPNKFFQNKNNLFKYSRKPVHKGSLFFFRRTVTIPAKFLARKIDIITLSLIDRLNMTR